MTQAHVFLRWYSIQPASIWPCMGGLHTDRARHGEACATQQTNDSSTDRLPQNRAARSRSAEVQHACSLAN